MINTSNETLDKIDVKFSDKSACSVIIASGGYPGKYETGYEINIPKDIKAQIYIAGAKEKEGKIYTSGGRVLAVTTTADTIIQAIEKTYKEVEKITFKNAHYRRDIGAKCIK